MEGVHGAQALGSVSQGRCLDAATVDDSTSRKRAGSGFGVDDLLRKFPRAH
jgi:hypothetical protein